ncbi:MAG: flagellar biosynthetic protein FliR [Gemmataceae bacterium]
MISLAATFFGLILARVGAFVAMLNVLGAGQTPRLVKMGLAVGLSSFWATTLWTQMAGCAWLCSGGNGAWLAYIIALAREVMLGAVIGFTFELFLLPARVAGEFLAQELGLTFGNIASATSSGMQSPLTIFLELSASAVFLALDGHHAFFGAMDGLFRSYPVAGGGPLFSWEGLVSSTAEAQEWGLMLAGPVALCLFLTTLMLNLLTRATPQFNLYNVGFPLRLGAGLVALLLLLPQLIASFVTILQQGTDLLGRVF